MSKAFVQNKLAKDEEIKLRARIIKLKKEEEKANKRIKEMETAHEERMRLKAEEFERWITQKENALEVNLQAAADP